MKISSAKINSKNGRVLAVRCNNPYPAGILPPEKLAGAYRPVWYPIAWLTPTIKTETTIDGNGLKALTSRCNMVPVSV